MKIEFAKTFIFQNIIASSHEQKRFGFRFCQNIIKIESTSIYVFVWWHAVSKDMIKQHYKYFKNIGFVLLNLCNNNYILVTLSCHFYYSLRSFGDT